MKTSEKKLAYNRAWRARNKEKIRSYDKGKRPIGPFVPPPVDAVPDPLYTDYSWLPSGACWSNSRIIMNGKSQRRIGGRFLKLSINYNQYRTVRFKGERANSTVMVAARMMATFGPPRPAPIQELQADGSTKLVEFEIGHEDQDKGNNAASNLSWTTRKQNIADYVASGRKWGRPTRHRLTEDEKWLIRFLYKHRGEKKTPLARFFGVAPITIYRIIGGYPWAQHRKAS